MERRGALKRYQDFQRWMWKECVNSLTLCSMKYGKKRCTQLLSTCDFCLESYHFEDTHCRSCHQVVNAAGKNIDYSERSVQCEKKGKLDHGFACHSSLPLGIRLLKALLASIEVCVPPEALDSFWTEDHRNTWGMRLNVSSSTVELLQILTLFESAIKRDCLSSNFEMTKELLGSSNLSGRAVYDSASFESVPALPWIPKTTAAVALRLFELDASIIYVKQEKTEPSEDKSVKVFMKLPSRSSPLKNDNVEQNELKQDEHISEENFTDLRSRVNSYKRGRGGRDQGYTTKWQGRVPALKSGSSRRNSRGIENLNQGLRQQGRRTNLQGSKVQGSTRGRRTVRKRRAEKMVAEETLVGHMSDTIRPMSYPRKKSLDPNSYSGSFRNLAKEEWGVEKVRMDVEDADNSNSIEAAESEDNVEEGYEQGNWAQGFNSASNGWNENPMEVSDDDGDASGDDNGIEVMGDEDSEGDIEMSDASDGVANKMENDDGTDVSVSDDYSD